MGIKVTICLDRVNTRIRLCLGREFEDKSGAGSDSLDTDRSSVNNLTVELGRSLSNRQARLRA
jgi:hypothetical protein